MLRLLVEGWRQINHSYALVNHNQLIQLQKLNFELFHNDLPFFDQKWNSKINSNGFDEESNRKIATIPAPKIPGQKFDVTYRIGYPYRLYPATSGKLFVFATTEYQCIHFYSIFNDGRPNAPDLKVITPSNWSKIGFLKAGLPEAQILVVPHGVDPDIYKPIDQHKGKEVRDGLNIREDDFLILSLGAMTENKGIDVLLMAFSVLRKRYSHLKLLLKDQSNLYGVLAQDLLSDLIKKHPRNFTDDVVSSIHFISQNLTLQQLNELYGSADCYVSPYRAEGFNLPPLEAAASGTPIIVTDGGATDDYCDPSFAMKISSKVVTEGNETFLEPNVDSLIEQITILVENKNQQLNPVVASEYINKNFSWAKVASHLADCFLA